MAKTRRADSRQARHCKRKADSSQAKSRQPTTKERTADTISTFFALAAIRLILARATGRVAGPAHRRVAEDRGCRVAGPASRAEAAAGSRYLVLVDKLSQRPSRPSWRKRVHPEDFLLDIAVKDGLIYTISNRRLATLRAYHSWSWDKLLFVRCNQELLNSKARIIKFCPHTIFNGSHAIVNNRLVSPSRRRKPSVRETCMPRSSPFEETIHTP